MTSRASEEASAPAEAHTATERDVTEAHPASNQDVVDSHPAPAGHSPVHAERRARSFEAWAADYDRYRPGYPEGLFDTIQARLALPSTPDVADLGAGTGKASVAMANRGWHVTAIEPGSEMLTMLLTRAARAGSTVVARQAIAEATGLEDASVDLVTAGQAFHWFDARRAVPEMARIIRPGGGVALFWNVRDDARSAFLGAYADLLEAQVPDARREDREPAVRSDLPDKLAVGGWFDVEPERIELAQEVSMTADEFVGLALTASLVRVMLDAQAQLVFADAIHGLLEEHAPGGWVAVPYRVDLWIGRRRNDSPARAIGPRRSGLDEE
jgi:SAM-dependent methyltransferase